MSRNTLAQPSHRVSRRPAILAASSRPTPQTESALRDLAYVFRLTASVREALLRQAGSASE